ncbi:RNA-binding protein RBM25 [Trichophyton interdigitale]|uniref:RNA-binding protein RBM25 n=1 Tax=Trichophyton interdigitale TaxID=101480 RepID=A0A9P4YFP3_9EURO|nr:RNA-binding protein RBM25 [Trichophyton interdigitale]KAF3893207.1 RNA-binding protein RBM25 [Trichophyton interdigitale]KAG8208384.1 RNA-binding protein RBM25 [Trichophyton interdigitale]
MYNPYQATGPYGQPPDFGSYPGAPPGLGGPPGLAPPGMAPPGTGAPPGMQQHNAQQPGRPGGFPPNFQPPANMPNINFSAPVIRLGTSGPPKSTTPHEGGRERGGDMGGRRGGQHHAASIESQRQNIREAIMQLQPPTKDEVVRTVFVSGITEGTGGDEGVERILRSAGNLRRWIRATDADNKPCKFGFAEYEDPESLNTAVEVLRDIEVPVNKQRPSDGEKGDEEVEMSKLMVVVDDSSLKYLEQYESNNTQEPEAVHSRLETARKNLAAVLAELTNPSAQVKGEGVDKDGDTAMGDGDKQADGTSAEVITIPITVEDELSDIPAEMRETVAKEIAAFRERSNRRDLERLKREEEIESLERARNAGHSRSNRLSSPSRSTSGPAGGANGIPLGPRDRSVPNAPSGPKGYGHQIPKDYQKGVSFVNNETEIIPEEDDTDASDSEVERRHQEKRNAELEKQALDQERRWLNRERSRTAAVEREKNREREEGQRAEEEKRAMAKRLREWNDDTEASRKVEEYYADRGVWIRKRATFRSREAAMDEADRAAEEREKAKEAQQQEQARGMAEDFLARQAQEMESRTQPRKEPQRFKLSLGAAAQKAQRRTVAEVEGLLEDEEDSSATARRPLTDIKFDSIAETAGLTDEERAQAARQLAAEIPSDKEGLWQWDVKWEFVDEAVLSDQLKPFVEKKIMEYLGVQEQMLVDVVEEHIRKRGSPQDLVEQLEGALDEEAEVLVKKLWRMIVFFSESEKRGLSS